MNQRTTGLVVGLVTFVILTVGLLASTIYFHLEAQSALGSKKQADDARAAAQSASTKAESAYKQLAGFVMGDAEMTPGEDALANIKKALAAEDVANLKVEFDSLRADREQLKQDNQNLKDQVAKAESAADTARAEAEKSAAAANAASKRVDADLGTYRTSVQKYETDVKSTVDSISKLQDEIDQRRRTEVAELQEKINSESVSKATLQTRVGELEKTVDQYRIKPENAASLADGRIIDVGSQNGEVFLSIGSKQRVQPGMTFDVYDSPASIQFNPSSGELIPGKARVQVLKVDENTSTARVIPESRRTGARTRPVVKDDVIANVIFSPDYRYKFLVHGLFDVDNDGTATAAEAEFVRGRISSWGGEVVTGDRLRGDLDFVVMGVRPTEPLDLPANADEGQYTAHFDLKRAYETYNALFNDAQAARVPVLNWNRMQVLTNEGR
jgi:FtsZ-binding cell division protein ZapB